MLSNCKYDDNLSMKYVILIVIYIVALKFG